jgi:hypothetical protein
MQTKSKAIPWWQTVVLAAIAAVVSAVATGSLAIIVDHSLWSDDEESDSVIPVYQ